MDSKYAIVVVRSGKDHHDDVALNYTQLSLDYQEKNRIPTQNKIDYFVVDDYTTLPGYDVIMVVQAGTIFLWGAYELHYKQMVEESPFEYITLNKNVWFHKPSGTGDTKFVGKHIHTLNTETAKDFYGSHDNLLTSLIDDSNITYLMHNEIPNYGPVTEPVDWAMTVSSGFFINCILSHHGYKDTTVVHHVDISKISLQVHRYTIRKWNGVDFPGWMKHLNEKFISMGLWNRRKFTEQDNKWQSVWDNVQEFFGDDWYEHWERYCSLEHKWHRMNIKDIHTIPKKGQGIIWWNGALKRLPSNLLKTSEQSHKDAVAFISRLPEDTICYGADHCDMQFDGVNANTACRLVSLEDSRKALWQSDCI